MLFQLQTLLCPIIFGETEAHELQGGALPRPRFAEEDHMCGFPQSFWERHSLGDIPESCGIRHAGVSETFGKEGKFRRVL